MSRKLAFMTIGILHERVGDPQVQGFVDRLPSVYAAAESSDGFYARSIRNMETWEHSWGHQEPPSCYPKPDDDARLAMTLSLWKDIESVAAFAYHGAHGEALSKRNEWFQSLGLPNYVAWWVPDGHKIDWEEGGERLDYLHANGPTAFAFNFAVPFDADGQPYKLDRQAVRAKVSVNAGGD
jgi:hypothetical protein